MLYFPSHVLKLATEEADFIRICLRQGMDVRSIVKLANEKFHAGRGIIREEHVKGEEQRNSSFTPCAECESETGAGMPQSRYAASFCWRYRRCLKALSKH